jgi:hypothetical protein
MNMAVKGPERPAQYFSWMRYKQDRVPELSHFILNHKIGELPVDLQVARFWACVDTSYSALEEIYDRLSKRLDAFSFPWLVITSYPHTDSKCGLKPGQIGRA